MKPESMTRKFWHQLILVGILCMAPTLLAATVLFQRSYTQRVDRYLAQVCAAVGQGYQALPDPQPQDLAALVPGGLRFTLIAPDGTVLYDTLEPGTTANHAARPEVQRALQTGSGTATRKSETAGYETHYHAICFYDADSQPLYLLRAADEVVNIWLATGNTLPLLALGCALVLALGAVFSWWLTRRLVRPITKMADHLDTIEAHVPYEELLPLARTLQSDRKLREDNETLRREFTANVSHELKTPLTSISGYAELLETGMARLEDVPTFGHRIHREASRMIALVSDILQLSELDGMQGQQSPGFEQSPLDLNLVIRETCAAMTMNARKAYVTLQYSAAAVPVTVNGSRDMLGELATNLCDNAIRYNRPGGHVQLSCGHTPEGCPFLCVEDNGIGIPQDAQARVFERFYRVDKSRSKATGGTGLGLAIVKHIAALHGAKIELSSTVGTGTTVRVTFPKAPV